MPNTALALSQFTTEYNKLDEETSVVILEYLHAQFGKRLLTIESNVPIWVSYSKQNRGEQISVQTLSLICRDAFGVSKNHAHAPITDLAAALVQTDIKITQQYVKVLEKNAENPLGKKLVERFGIRRKGR